MITSVLAMPEVADELQGMSLVFVTDFGSVRRNAAREFADVRKNGKIAVKLDDDNGNPVGRLMAVLLADDKDDVILATRDGFVTRFSVSDLRMFVGRNSTGVRGLSLRSEEHTSELQSLMRISYAVFCLTKTNHRNI